MKLSKFAIVLSSLFFFSFNSHADTIIIKECRTNPHDYLVFNESDHAISEKIVDHQFANNPDLKDDTIVEIYTNDYYEDRNDWIASFTFEDKHKSYLLYQVDKDEFTELDQNQYQFLLAKIVKCNADKQQPIYSLNFDVD